MRGPGLILPQASMHARDIADHGHDDDETEQIEKSARRYHPSSPVWRAPLGDLRLGVGHNG
jgi:hypothetical protein